MLSPNQREAEDLDHGNDGRAPTERPVMGRMTETTDGSRSPTSSGRTAFELEKSSPDDAAPRLSAAEAGVTELETGRTDRCDAMEAECGCMSFDAASVSTRPDASPLNP